MPWVNADVEERIRQKIKTWIGQGKLSDAIWVVETCFSGQPQNWGEDVHEAVIRWAEENGEKNDFVLETVAKAIKVFGIPNERLQKKT